MNALFWVLGLIGAAFVIYIGYKAIRAEIKKNQEFEQQYRYALCLQMDRELDQQGHNKRIMETLDRWEKEREEEALKG